jgi:hypothetical protein
MSVFSLRNEKTKQSEIELFMNAHSGEKIGKIGKIGSASATNYSNVVFAECASNYMSGDPTAFSGGGCCADKELEQN